MPGLKFLTFPLAGWLLMGTAKLPAESDLVDCGNVQALQRMVLEPTPFNELTGESPEHFPEDQQIDIEHIRLEMDFPGLETKSASVVETIVFNSPWEARSDITLDARMLDIQSIDRLDDSALTITQTPERKDFSTREGLEFFASGDRLSIHFATPIAKGERVAIRLRYTLHDPHEGLMWIEPLANDLDTRWEVWSQGESWDNRSWFAGHDYPNDRITSEIIARVPLPNVVSAAGALVSRVEGGDGTATYHWRIEQSHVNYLATLVIGQFAVSHADANGTPLEFYVPPARADDVERTFGKTAAMIAFFAKRFDEPFPFPRYAQLVVRDFTAGGMENVTATTLVSRVLVSESTAKNAPMCNGPSETLIAHELAHSWFGDLITCKNWSHLWLNEGFASYCQTLWAEESCGREEYDYLIWQRRRGVAASDPPDSQQPVIFRRPENPDAMFDFGGGLVYQKGGYILHMLRQKLGEEDFWKGMVSYVDLYKNQCVDTDQFRGAMEAASGRDLEAFFRQWCERPGTPAVTATLEYEIGSRQAVVTIEQTGKLTADNPAFRGDVPVFLKSGSGESIERTFEITERRHVFRIPLDKAPAVFAVDAKGSFLMNLTLKAPANVLRDTALQGPTIMARCDAIHAFARDVGAGAVPVLRELVEDEKAFHGIREEAANALGEISDNSAADALTALAQAMIDKPSGATDWRIRKDIAGALGKQRGDAVAKVLIRLADDPSEPVSAAALEGMAALPGAEIDVALSRGIERRGDHDRIAVAALAALTKRRSPAAVDAAIKLTAADVSFFATRAAAVRSLGELLQDRELPVQDSPATRRLLDLTSDPRQTVRRSAINALGQSRYNGAIPALQQIAAKVDDEADATAAKNAITAINSKPGSREDVKALEEKMNALETKLDALQKSQSVSEPRKKRRRILGIF